MRCEMRAATLSKRARAGRRRIRGAGHVDVHGHPHRDDPHSCYLERVALRRTLRSTATISSARTGRHVETAPEASVRRTEHLGRLGRGAGGADAFSTEWRPRRSRAGGSLREAYAAGKIRSPRSGARNPAPSRPHNPGGRSSRCHRVFACGRRTTIARLQSRRTSIVFDCTFALA